MKAFRLFYLFILITGCSDRTINFVNEVAVVGDCPSNYIRIEKNGNYVSEEFCVAKYEMKNDGFGNAISVPTGSPWVNIDLATATAACQSLGGSYDLISNAQWQTIARNIERVGANWEDGVVGVGSINRGHSDNVPPFILSINSDDPYASTGQMATEDFGSGGEQKRTHQLLTGDEIWDFAGNVREWVKDTNITAYGVSDYIAQVTATSHLTLGALDDGAIRAAKSQFGPIGDYQLFLAPELYAGLGYAVINASSGGVVRSGSFSDLDQAGIYYINLNLPVGSLAGDLGFRCVYYPENS